MTLRRRFLPAVALTIAVVTDASAQFAPMGKPPCFDDFAALRDEAQKRADAVRAAQARKASLPEACQLITRFTEVEAKVVEFAENNGAWCGISSDLVTTMRNAHAKSIELRKRVCGGGTPPKRMRIASFDFVFEFERNQ
jgi:hypothetical protein